MSAAAPVLLLASLLVGGSCRPPESSDAPLRLTARLLDEEPAELFTLQRVVRPEAVITWSFDEPADLAGWTTTNVSETAAGGNGNLRIAAGDGYAVLERQADLDAGQIQAVRVGIAGHRARRTRLEWAQVDQEYSPDNQVALGPESTFDLSTAAGWRGRIGKLRLVLGTGTMWLQSIEALRNVIDPGELASALERAWKVDLGHELRSARLALPGVPLDWTVDLPADSSLRFAYGVSPAIRQPIGFRVTARREGEVERQLFDGLVEGSAQTGGWHEATADLSSLGSGPVTLSFSTHAEDHPPDPSVGFLAWGQPEILSPAEGPAPPNVVLVSLDTLRADHLSLYGYPLPTSPHLDAWAGQSAVVFENVVASAPWTLPSHASMFTGLSAVRHGVNYTRAPQRLTLLAERLRQAGYTTAAITGGAYLSPEYGLGQGFDLFRYNPRAQSDDELEKGVDQALGWLRAHGRSPFFLFLHSYAVHGPYRVRQPFTDALGGVPPEWSDDLVNLEMLESQPDDGFARRAWFLRQSRGSGKREPVATEDLGVVERLYDSGVAYADRETGRLLAALRESGLDRKTVVIVTSDHGEALGEKGFAMHGQLYDFDLMVPLLVALPGAEGAGLRVAEQVGLVDLVPTVLELTGQPVPPDLDGFSLLPLILQQGSREQPEVWSYAAAENRGVSVRIGNRIKYLFNDTAWSAASGAEELYFLAEDPDEDLNVADGAAQTPRLRGRAEAMLRRYHRGVTVSFVNTSEVPFRGFLAGDLPNQTRIKSPDGDCPCLVWRRPGEAAVEVPAGKSLRLMLKETQQGRLRLGGGLADGARLEETVELAQLERPWRRVWDGAAWRSSGRGTMLVSVRFDGTAEDRAVEPVHLNERLLEQLKALGYVR